MANPFAAIRHKPAGATYGRKALAARRLADPAGPRPPLAEREALSSSSSISSASSSAESDSDASQKRSRARGDTEGTGGGAQARRTAGDALARLDSLYESTKTPVCSDASPSALLESTKNSWDLGGSGAVATRGHNTGDPVPTQQARRSVKDN
ncbi:hypothetical protein H4R19_006769, partial [Coemansia spiralis]